MTYVVAFDGSESARRALALAAPLPRSDDTLALVAVVSGSADGRVDESSGAAVASSYRGAVQQAEEVLAEAAARLEGNGWKVTTQVLIGDPAQEICRYAEAAQADVIVVGGRPATAVQDHVNQSVSDAVLHRSRRPVLVCR